MKEENIKVEVMYRIHSIEMAVSSPATIYSLTLRMTFRAVTDKIVRSARIKQSNHRVNPSPLRTHKLEHLLKLSLVFFLSHYTKRGRTIRMVCSVKYILVKYAICIRIPYSLSNLLYLI